ncbi:MAG: TetR/AcrR family transcriptional regulator [Alphaproteobacteria bacterium]
MTAQKLDTPPRPAENEKTRAIVDAARREFAARGFAAARLDDIARAAGVAKGTIYLYFDSKAALFEGVVRGHLVPQLEAAEALIAAHDGPVEDLLRLLLRTLCENVLETDLREVVRLLIAEGPNFPEIRAFYYREVVARGMALLGDLIRRGEARGEFRVSGAADMPQLVMAPFMVAAVWKSLFEDLAPLDAGKLIETHLDVLMRGLRAS